MGGAEDDIPLKAAEIAAKRTGLRADQVAAAVKEYRYSLAALSVEPEWTMLSHMSGGQMAVAQYAAEATAVVLQVDSWKERGQWKSERCYVFRSEAFETFAEAKAAEDLASAKFVIRPVPSPPTVGG
jgi:hypothetical protein